MMDFRLWAAALMAAAALSASGCSAGRDAIGAINPFDGDGEGPDQGEIPDADRRISLVSFEARLEADPALASAPVTLPNHFTNPLWPMEGGYPTHAVRHPRVGDDIRRAWRRSVGEGSSRQTRVVAPPVTADGVIYAMDGSGDVSAMSVENGSRIWRARLRSDARRDREGRGGGIAVMDGHVYAASGHGYVAALDAETGAEIWRRDTGSPMHAPPTVVDGRLFAVSFDNELFAISTETGEVLWTYQSLSEPARILSASSPAVSGDVVVAPFASGEIVALIVQNGREVWSQALTRSGRTTGLSSLNDIAGSPVIESDVVYAVSHSGVLSAVSLRTGERLWDNPAGGIHMPWVVGEYVFVVTTDAELACIRREDGAVRWVAELPRYRNENRRRGRISWAGPVLAGGRLFLASSEGDLIGVSPQNGEIVEEHRMGGAAYIAPIVAQETLYVLTDDANLVAFR